MFFAIFIAGLIGILSVILWNLKHRHLYKYTKDIPGLPTYPIIGNALDLGRNPVDFLNCICESLKTYGPISRIWIGSNKIYILIADLDLAEHILSSSKYIRKSSDYKLLESWLGSGLLTSTGSHWQKRRKIITPTFHFKILEQFVPIINSAGEILIEKLSKVPENERIDIYKYATAYALDVICETAMGTSVNAQNDPNNEYCTAVRTMSKIFIIRSFSFWKQHDTLFKFAKEYSTEQQCLKVLHGFTRSVIENRRKMLMETAAETDNKTNNEDDDIGRKKRIAFLDLLLQSTLDGAPLTDDDIAAEVDTFMFEGHDTTSSAISFGLHSIAKYPEVQNKMLEELSSILGDDKTRALTLQDINNMKYVECVAKETLRMYPSVPYMGRKLDEDVEFKGKLYPKDAMIAIVPYFMHRNPKIFKNPDEFNPERFNNENIEFKQHPFAYIPFSAGPRNCIGQKFAMLELKATLIKVVQHFELSSADAQYDPILSGEAILKSANGVFLKLKKRN